MMWEQTVRRIWRSSISAAEDDDENDDDIIKRLGSLRGGGVQRVFEGKTRMKRTTEA